MNGSTNSDLLCPHDRDADPGPSADAQPRSVPWVLGWVSFFQDFGSKMLVPIMPLFLTQVLGVPPDRSRPQRGGR